METGKRISKKQESQSNTSLILLCCVIFLICIVALYLVNTTGTRTLLQMNDITDSTEKKSIPLPQRPESLVSSIYGSIAHAKVDTLAMNTSESSNSTIQNQSESQNVSNNIIAENTSNENIDKPQENESKNIDRPWKSQENENKEKADKPQENENKEKVDRPWKSQENENKEKADKPQENENKDKIDRPWKKKENESKEDSVRPWKRSDDSKKEKSEYKRINKDKDKENKEQKTKEDKGKESKEKEQKVKAQESKEKDKKTKEKEDPKKDSKNKKEDKGKPLEEHLAMLYLKTTPGNWVKEPVKNDRVLLSLLEKSTQFRIAIHLFYAGQAFRLENSDVVSVDNPSQMFEKFFKPQIEEQFTQLTFKDSRAKYPRIGNVKKREGTGISKDKLRMKYYALLVQIKFKEQYYYCVFGMPFSQYKRTPYAIENILRQMYFKEK